MRTEMVSFRSNGDKTDGYLAEPGDGKHHPGVVVIQEWWGLEPHVKDIVERVARAGYIAVAPDLYHGKVAKEPDDAMKHMMALDMSHAVKEIAGAARYLAGRPDVEPKKVGVIGFCMGGRLALKFGESSELAGAIAAFYPGYYQPSVEDAAKIQAPTLIQFGADDESIPARAREQIENNLKTAGKTVQVHTYEGAGHAFLNDTHPTHRPEPARQAWEKAMDWFATHLKGATVR